MLKTIVVGGSGMLGSDLVLELRSRGYEVSAPSPEELDITDPVSVAGIGRYDWCFNCAAYTAVDKAESEPDAATLVNTIGPGYVAKACALTGTRLIHVSTDFVFDGAANSPYREDDRPDPLGVYARTKLGGEEAVGPGAIVVRTAWLYGPSGVSFPRTIIRAWLAGKQLRVVSDQLGSPTYTAHLAKVMVDIAERDLAPGIYHAAGPDVMSWHEFAKMAVEAYSVEGLKEDRPIEIEAIRTEDWPTAAVRPRYSALSSEKLVALGIGPMPLVKEGLVEFVRRMSVGD